MQKVNILGSDYEIVIKKYEDEPAFKERSIDGYCDPYLKEIAVCDMSTYPGWEGEPSESLTRAQKQTLRHEIVHAFLDESGLNDCASLYGDAWSKNEEMIDWIAWQGEKIYKAWQQADAL